MWALKPSILELLATKLKPHEPLLASESPILQYHILFLLKFETLQLKNKKKFKKQV